MELEELLLELQRFSIWDYSIFVLMLFICIIIGIYFGLTNKKDESEYLMGGRKMMIMPIALSLIAR